MAYRSISQNATASTGLVVTPPAGIVNGDILVALAVSNVASGTMTYPAGFTELTGSPAIATWSGQSLYAALKVASSESGNYTLSCANAVIGAVMAISGRDATVTPHRSSVDTNSSGNGTPWTITSAAFSSVTSQECDIIWIAGSDAGDGPVAHTPPGGMTERADISTDFVYFLTVATQDAVASGATGVLAGSGACAGASSGWDVFAIALAIAGGGVAQNQLAWVTA